MRKEKIMEVLTSRGALGVLTLCLVGTVAFATYRAGYGNPSDPGAETEISGEQAAESDGEAGTEGADLTVSGQKIEATIEPAHDYTAANELDVDPATLVSSGNGEAEETQVSTEAVDAASAAVIQPTVSFGEDSSMIWPAAGVVLMDYDMDNTVYFKTLNEYKYNPALLIGSDTGNPVVAAAKGIVEAVTVDEETGTTLRLNIGDNYDLIYGQLTDVAVAEGDVVEQGQLLAHISDPTKYYCEEGSSLYFEMEKDGLPVDPMLYLG